MYLLLETVHNKDLGYTYSYKFVDIWLVLSLCGCALVFRILNNSPNHQNGEVMNFDSQKVFIKERKEL